MGNRKIEIHFTDPSIDEVFSNARLISKGREIHAAELSIVHLKTKWKKGLVSHAFYKSEKRALIKELNSLRSS